MISFFRNSMVTMLFTTFFAFVLACIGCGTGDYNEKLDTAIQNAKSGVKPTIDKDVDDMTDAELQAMYALEDDEDEDEPEDDDVPEDDGYDDEDDYDDDGGDEDSDEDPFEDVDE